ncbi:MAG: SH3 domain-containing protein [Anaerolineae bacterium]|nr:SH3 domain-containing protein [Anaerolineae bacterium]
MRSLHKWAMGIIIATAAALPTLAQGDPTSMSDVITLDDATPSVTASVALPANTTGVVKLDLSMASVVITDAQGNVVFRQADPRVRALELSIAPNSGDHTITIERLPAHTQAFARIRSLADMTATAAVNPVATNTLTLDQSYPLPLTNAVPSGSVQLNVPANTSAVVTARYPASDATAQLVDNSGAVVATAGAAIDGLGIVLDSGVYDFTLRTSPATPAMSVDVQMHALDASGYVLLPAPANTPITVADTTSAPAAAACNATVSVAAANMRSGPGTSYSILGTGFSGLNVPVGGTNADQSWLLVGTPNGASAWVGRDLVQLAGNCSNLTVYNIPQMNGQGVQIISGNGFRGDDDRGEHDD